MIALMELVDGPGIYADATGSCWIRLYPLPSRAVRREYHVFRRLRDNVISRFNCQGECIDEGFPSLVKKTYEITAITAAKSD